MRFITWAPRAMSRCHSRCRSIQRTWMAWELFVCSRQSESAVSKKQQSSTKHRPPSSLAKSEKSLKRSRRPSIHVLRTQLQRCLHTGRS
ncbi:hypothetical protein ATCV1_z805L [Acanthocystis turfacea chlorella virus 1]|uniref:Uncharacterized protein z805L n=1 Tax=Chlorovirus heliozoae TaxID=322019 RepID=A7KA65_9PHYC|nr:hypothetical protein ATCV1_z805L [Acanthocystis turfacea chlorella virus 1]ABT16939.1 hypothetical protein ATCV1_z805L [Acanthocystis turfacea chlorella virus 1]